MYKYFLIYIIPVYSHLILNGRFTWGINDMSLEMPMDKNTQDYVCRGEAPISRNTKVVFTSNKTYGLNIICGEKNLNAPGCLIGDWHTDNNGDYAGCALSISYNSNPNRITRLNQYYLGNSKTCARRGEMSNFKINNVPSCEKCICSWNWAPSRKYSSPAQFYQNCFYCKIINNNLNVSISTLKKFEYINSKDSPQRLRDITFNDLL
jgi:hypothetical protein